MSTSGPPRTRTFASQIRRSVFHQTLTHAVSWLATVGSRSVTTHGPPAGAAVTVHGPSAGAADAGAAVATEAVVTVASAVPRIAPIRRMFFIAIPPDCRPPTARASGDK